MLIGLGILAVVAYAIGFALSNRHPDVAVAFHQLRCRRMIILLDNGSKRPAATLSLRNLAARLLPRVGEDVHPVSLLHSSAIAPKLLGGRPAQTLEPFLRRQVERGERSFVIAPLFFGPSRAIDRFLPEVLAAVAADHGPLEARVAPVLCPIPRGEPRLVDILQANTLDAIKRHALDVNQAILVDHGSPVFEVTAVRRWLASELAERFRGDLRITEAVMERRRGPQFDFNGRRLEEVLATLPTHRDASRLDLVLTMQFLAPGRHAGPGGDIDKMIEAVTAQRPQLRIVTSRLVGDSPLLCDILADRIAEASR